MIVVCDIIVEGVEIKKDSFIGMVEGKIKVSCVILEEVVYEILEKLFDDDSEIIIIIVGEDVDILKVEMFVDKVIEVFFDVEVEIYEGD